MPMIFLSEARSASALFLRQFFFGGVVRVGADGAPDVGQGGEADLLLGARKAGADGDHLADAGGVCAGNDVRQLGGREIVQVAV